LSGSNVHFVAEGDLVTVLREIIFFDLIVKKKLKKIKKAFEKA